MNTLVFRKHEYLGAKEQAVRHFLSNSSHTEQTKALPPGRTRTPHRSVWAQGRVWGVTDIQHYVSFRRTA